MNPSDLPAILNDVDKNALSVLGGGLLTFLAGKIRARVTAKREAATLELSRDKFLQSVNDADASANRALADQFRQLMQDELNRLRARSVEQDSRIEKLAAEKALLMGELAVAKAELKVQRMDSDATAREQEARINDLTEDVTAMRAMLLQQAELHAAAVIVGGSEHSNPGTRLAPKKRGGKE